MAALLNDVHDYCWGVDGKGNVIIEGKGCGYLKFSQFEALSKSLDSEALTALVRMELGAGGDERKSVPDLVARL